MLENNLVSADETLYFADQRISKMSFAQKKTYIKDDSRIFTLNQLDIKTNSELILNIKNQPTVVKLFF